MAETTINEASITTTPNTHSLFVLAPQETVDSIMTVKTRATVYPKGQCFMHDVDTKLVPFDGTAPCIAVAPFDIDATGGDVDSSVFVEGMFATPALIREAAMSVEQTFLNALAGSRISAKTPI